jgi:tetratricopeptide (TPR) repeat protein
MVSLQLPFMAPSLKRFLTVLVLNCLLAGAVMAQNREAEFKEVYPNASKLFDNEEYTEALNFLLGLHKLSPRNANINYLIGRCYLNLPGYKEKAVPYLEVAAASTTEKYKDQYKETNAPLDAFFYLGRAYHLNLDFDKAITAYRQYLSKGNVWDEEEKIAVKRLVQNCQNAKLIIESPMSVELVPIGKNINSQFDEYAAVVDSAETTLIFTSRRPLTSDATNRPGRQVLREHLHLTQGQRG